MQCAATLVDICAVRRRAEERCLNAAQAEQLRRFRRSSAIRAIHQHPQPAQIRSYIRSQPLDIGAAKFSFPGQAGRKSKGSIHVGLGILQQGKNFLLNRDFMRVRQFVSVAGEDLDAIVGPGIVRRRDHHSRGIFAGARQVGNAGRRNYARAVDFNSAGGQPQRHSICDPGAGFARILSDHRASLGVAALQIMAQRAANHIGAVLGQGKFAGDAANPIGSEELSRLGCHAQVVMRKMSRWIATAQCRSVPGVFSMITVTRTGLGFIT